MIVRNTAEEASSGHCHEEQSSTKRKRKHTAIITESNEHELEHTVAKKQRQGKNSPTPREKRVRLLPAQDTAGWNLARACTLALKCCKVWRFFLPTFHPIQPY